MNKAFNPGAPSVEPPSIPARAYMISLFNHDLADDFAWLKAPNWQDVLQDPAALPEDIREILQQENAFMAQAMAGTEKLRVILQDEMRARIKEKDSSVPERDGKFLYFTKYVENAQHVLFCRTEDGALRETVLLDANQEAAASAYFNLGGAEPSPNHNLLAWSADTNGSEYYTIRVRDLDSGDEQADIITRTSGAIVWLGDNSGFYYIVLDDKHRPTCVRRHILGTAVEDDETVYTENDSGFFIHIGETRSRAFIIIGANDHETSEAWLLDANDKHAVPRLVHKRETGLQYEVEHLDDRLVILTNVDGAEDFKIMTAPLSAPGKENWQDLIPYEKGTMILSLIPFPDFLVRLERKDAKPRIIVRELATSEEHEIAFEDDIHALGIDPCREFNTTILRFNYSSLRMPAEIYDYDLSRRTRILRKRQEIPSGHNPDDYIVTRIFAKATDGEDVPVSLLHSLNTRLDGSAPCLLYGYGSYGHSIDAGFRSNALSLVNRGFVYAIAHIRGGTEKGWHWYQDGKREKKTNTFTDFIACAERLITLGYTSRGAIVAQGGSAGGMLMGAVANMAPDLFAGIIAEVPFVDVLNTMLDASLPLTPPEWPEWGNPIESEQDFKTILSYSPYDNIKAQNYPAILALGGLTDPRVTYWEPTKWVARLRATMTGGGPVMLRTNMEAGHGGASGRFDRLEEIALTYAFAIAAASQDGVTS